MTKRKLDVRELETLETGGGNTIPPPVRVVPSKRWCFTYNNYPDDAVERLETVFGSFSIDYIFGKEVGEEGTKHLQGYIEAPIKIRPIEKLGLPKEIHWEKTRGTRIQNITYCSKDGDYVHSLALKPPRQMKLIEPRGWQLEVVEIAKAEPNERDIYWFWEQTGGVGKTVLCKYLIKKHGAIVLGGKAADIKNGIVTYVEKHGSTPELVVVNLTRSTEGYVSYEGLESIKDMMFYSGKYEGGQVCGPCPQLIVFANFCPDYGKLSMDRWKVTMIDPLTPEPGGNSRSTVQRSADPTPQCSECAEAPTNAG